jgi:glycosyltransferase involved in cell wall biosynthesis
MGDRMPALVFAGQGGGDTETVRIMSEDGLMWNRKLFLVESPTDGEVAWLYENCAFTIFPSLSEGWGLPITESLSYGKYCLAADNSSQPEAGQGLAFHAENMDGAAWLAEIRRLVTEPGYREAMNTRVAANYRSRSWDDVSTAILGRIDYVCASPAIETARTPQPDTPQPAIAAQ